MAERPACTSGGGQDGDDDPEWVRLFGLRLRNTTLEQAAEEIVDAAASGLRQRIAFVNTHCVNVAASDAGYYRALQSADKLYVDGSGMALAARLAGIDLKDNVNGTDLFPILCERAAARGLSIGLLGARPGRAKRCAELIKERNPSLKVAWSHHGFFGPAEQDEILAGINASGTDILLVGMGVPRQDLWLESVSGAMRPPVTMGVGALMDFYSGAIRRAPRFLRDLGLEWVFRLALEPVRLFGRYVLGNPRFVGRILLRRLEGKAALSDKSLW